MAGLRRLQTTGDGGKLKCERTRGTGYPKVPFQTNYIPTKGDGCVQQVDGVGAKEEFPPVTQKSGLDKGNNFFKNYPRMSGEKAKGSLWGGEKNLRRKPSGQDTFSSAARWESTLKGTLMFRKRNNQHRKWGEQKLTKVSPKSIWACAFAKRQSASRLEGKKGPHGGRADHGFDEPFGISCVKPRQRINKNQETGGEKLRRDKERPNVNRGVVLSGGVSNPPYQENPRGRKNWCGRGTGVGRGEWGQGWVTMASLD